MAISIGAGIALSAIASAAGAAKAGSDSSKASKYQMDYQRDMSNTAHAREVADLRAAGLNPILSAKYGGSSTPSGSQPSVIPNIGGAAASSALAAYTQMNAAKNVKADTILKKAQAITERETARKEVAAGNQFQTQAGINALQQNLLEYQQPGALNESRLQSAMGTLMKGISPASTASKAMLNFLKIFGAKSGVR